ncbi:AAA family ATPase [Pseudomonas aeruginosa]|uniref:AAA family ATPase n=2 Tax=Pseudomonas aeruginosa TaxID=287 RepID=UPI003457767C
MDKLTEILFEDRPVPLTKTISNANENTFSILIGKNGVGKSRLLTEIINHYSKIYSEEKNSFRQLYSKTPSTIISVSTSPFDKFPLPITMKHRQVRNYHYVGMRGQPVYANNAMALISSAAMRLLTKYRQNSRHENFYEVFSLLGLSPSLSFVFKINIKKSLEIKIRNTTQDHLFELDYEDTGVIWFDMLGEPDDITMEELLDPKIYEEYTLQSPERKRSIAKSLNYIWERLDRKKDALFKYDFKYRKNTKQGAEDIYMIESLITLLELGALKLIDLKLTKNIKGNSQELSLRRASSGEQCLLVIILGIAGSIENNTLILIDEPEISLHPSWQEKFMDLLIKVFADYEKCHFIIATHSPQIVSRLSSENCFITIMGENKIYEAKEYYNRSADFQLTELFDAPGIMNEYITRLGFQLLTKVKNKKFMESEDWDNLEKLKEFLKKLDSTDPNSKLIETVIEVCELYASN